MFVNKRKKIDKILGTKLKVADASLKALFVRLLHVCFLSMPKSVYIGFIAYDTQYFLQIDISLMTSIQALNAQF